MQSIFPANAAMFADAAGCSIAVLANGRRQFCRLHSGHNAHDHSASEGTIHEQGMARMAQRPVCKGMVSGKKHVLILT